MVTNFPFCCMVFECERSLPGGWLDVNGSKSFPLVHVSEVSSWLPELQSMSLCNNRINMTAYHALQSVIGWPSLQILDLSNNELSGTLEGSFERHYCQEGGGGACEFSGIKMGASVLSIVLLASNVITGELLDVTLPPSLSVLSISGNMLHGSLPGGYAQLLIFFAGGEMNYWIPSHPNNSPVRSCVASVTRAPNES